MALVNSRPELGAVTLTHEAAGPNTNAPDFIGDPCEKPRDFRPQWWSEAVVAREASCKARHGHRRSLRVYLDTVHSLSSSWDPTVRIRVPFVT